MVTRSSLILTLAFLTACSASQTRQPPQLADISGVWHIVADTPSGVHEATMFVEQAGTEMTGRFEGDLGVMNFAGKVESNEIRFGHQAMAGSVRFDYIGQVSGGAMSGSAIFGDLGTGKWTARRVDKQ